MEEIIELTDKLFIFNYDENGEILKGEEDSNVEKSQIENKADEIKEEYGLNDI